VGAGWLVCARAVGRLGVGREGAVGAGGMVIRRGVAA